MIGSNCHFTFDKQQDPRGYFELVNIPDPSLPTPPRTVAVLNVIRELDFETQQLHTFTITVQDCEDKYGNPPRTTTGTVTVKVEDIQDTNPRFYIFDSNKNIDENWRDNTTDEVIANFLAKDGDQSLGITRQIEYSIPNGNEEGYFKIERPSGSSEDPAKLKRAKTIDAEALNTTFFTLNIKATEIDENGTETAQSTEQTCVVFVSDIEDNDPMFNFETFTSVVDEDIYKGYALVFNSTNGEYSSITVTDADVSVLNNRFRLRIVEGPPASQAFQLSPPNIVPGQAEVILIVNDTSLLDYENQDYQEYIITIAVDDVNGVEKNSATVTVKVNGKNDNWPQWEVPPYDREPIVQENAPSGTEILMLKARDGDIGMGNTLRYSLADRSFEGKELFSVDSETGMLSVADGAEVDWERFRSRNGSVTIYVIASDEVDDPLVNHRNETSFDIRILDVNDNHPVFANIQDSEADENTRENTILPGSVMVSDNDQPGTSNTEMEFEILRINCTSEDECANPGDAMGLVKLASDKGNPPSSTTQICHLHIKDINDETPNIIWPEIDQYTFNVKESLLEGSYIFDSNTGAEFYMEATDNDFGDNAMIVFSLVNDTESLFRHT
ncbi:unnamed protein product [Darwinula stevensoni]|uniref:Cadherin domain-containing protein n=1 Tax=Darwinula stevensoni TaxID=69355 RepID=A0A7R8XAY1_9CRUS|nr:unnamed protein product [Darwinula stevensoni]CAG0892344.1 unnamed protein product [Darwinula stevensoni]